MPYMRPVNICWLNRCVNCMSCRFVFQHTMEVVLMMILFLYYEGKKNLLESIFHNYTVDTFCSIYNKVKINCSIYNKVIINSLLLYNKHFLTCPKPFSSLIMSTYTTKSSYKYAFSMPQIVRFKCAVQVHPPAKVKDT